MAIHHASPGEPIDVHPLGTSLPVAKTIALFKSRDLEVMRLVLVAGKSLPTHKVPGEVTIHCIEGSLDVTIDGVSHVIGAGQLVLVAGDAPHAVTAIENASALVTIVVRK